MTQSPTRRPAYGPNAAAMGSAPGSVYGASSGGRPHRTGDIYDDDLLIEFETTGSRGGSARAAAGRPQGGAAGRAQAGRAQGGRPQGGPGGRPPGNGSGRRPAGPAAPAPRKKRDPLWARLVIFFGAFLMLLSGGAIVGGKYLLYQATSGVDKAPLLGNAGAGTGAKALKGELNLLMVGIDERPQGNDLIRADSILVLHIPADRKGAYLFSLPRDAYVEIPPYPKTKFKGSKEKVNAAFAWGSANGGGREGGFELLALTLQRLTGLSFNAGGIVNFQGFVGVVNALGGVDMCVDTTKPVVSEHFGTDPKTGKFKHPNDGGKPAVYNPGYCGTFDGAHALDYVRQRKSLDDGDYGRARHQQQFFKALAKKAKSQGLGSNPKKSLDIVKAGGAALTVDLRGASIDNWLFTVKDLADSDVVLLKANGGQFNSINCNGGESCEQLNEKTLEMFKAMREDTLSDFVLANPNFINASS
jgi:LCP family protein required for cell wall assembly